MRPVEAFGSGYLEEIRAAFAEYYVTPGNVLEWGSGHSTGEIARAVEDIGCSTFLTIDHNAQYLREVLNSIGYRPWLRGVAVDLTGPKTGDRDPEVAYSTLPLVTGLTFSAILIDGRRRVECALVAALVADPGALVLLHDYRRGRYQPVRALFDVVHEGEQFLVMRSNPDASFGHDWRAREHWRHMRANPSAEWFVGS